MQKVQSGNLKNRYTNEIRGKLETSFGKENIYEVPKLEKIVINTSFGRIAPDKIVREKIINNLAVITGQKPIFTTAKKAIAGFKTRKGQVIGAKATLRGDKMYHFFEKLVSIVIPRLRDFRGMSAGSFDKKGNYSIGFDEINIFPEIEYNRGEKAIGLEINICTTAKTQEEAKKLLTKLGMAFERQKNEANKEFEAAAHNR
jgi:large subunit ribosomal protein L5